MSARHIAGNESSSWPTAGFGSRRQVGGEEREQLLEGQARMWATPVARDYRSDESQKTDEELYGKKGKPLPRQIIGWPSPTAADSERQSTGYMRGNPTLLGASLQAQETSTDGSASSPSDPTSRRRRKLNPLFVEWLMGWPIGWTSLAPLGSGSRATEWFRSRRHLLGALCGGGS